MIKSRRIQWERHVACMEMRNAYIILIENPEGDYSQDL
jgi:hypothetical protein